MRRCLLFVPGDREGRIRKAAGLGADVVILDLEDGVDASRKEEARRLTAELLTQLDFHASEPAVRVNAQGTAEYEADLQAAEGKALVFVPKVESPEGVPQGCVACIETAKGVLNAGAIAARAAGVMFGAFDLAAELGAAVSWETLLFARSQVVMAAAAAGIEAYDAPWADLRDGAGLEEECARSRRLGFAGKAAIHPSQIEPIRRCFAPGVEEVEWARRVVAAAEESGSGAIRVDGRMVDMAMVRAARRVLERAK